MPLCLCVCSGERSLKLAEIFSGSPDSATENSEEPNFGINEEDKVGKVLDIMTIDQMLKMHGSLSFDAISIKIKITEKLTTNIM